MKLIYHNLLGESAEIVNPRTAKDFAKVLAAMQMESKDDQMQLILIKCYRQLIDLHTSRLELVDTLQNKKCKSKLDKVTIEELLRLL